MWENRKQGVVQVLWGDKLFSLTLDPVVPTQWIWYIWSLHSALFIHTYDDLKTEESCQVFKLKKIGKCVRKLKLNKDRCETFGGLSISTWDADNSLESSSKFKHNETV